MDFPTAEEKLTTAIMPGDVVRHRPTGEEWVICGVNYERGELIPCGYPFPSIAQISDCELVEKNYDKGGQSLEHIKALQKAGLPGFIDVASAMFHEII